MIIKGILFEHGKDNYEMWQGFCLTEKEQSAIMDILNKHQKEGGSVSGNGKQIAKSIVDGYITKKQAKEFYHDLCVTAYGDSGKRCQGVMNVEHIADIMGIEVNKAESFCSAMITYGITERQGGGIVV